MSLDRVPGGANLYIGGLISLRRYEALKKANITHVVSALRLPLDNDLFAAYKHHVIQVDDVDDEDIIQYFAESNTFIQDGLDNGGGVLVHCAMGKSRSATLVVAYLLSKSASATPESALESIRTVREICEPNEGFMQQLQLYHSMGCPVNVSTQSPYQRWLYQREVEMSIACGQAPATIRFEDEASDSPEPSPQTTNADVEFRCRRCRRSLARTPYVLTHTPKAPPATQAARMEPIASLDAAPVRPATLPQCAHIFLDPLSWMREELEQGKLEGRLECPNVKCGSNVGKYAWQGLRCNCGEWVVPAISLARGRVDEVRPGPKASVAKLSGKM